MQTRYPILSLTFTNSLSGLREDAHLNFFNGHETLYLGVHLMSSQACSSYWHLALNRLLVKVHFPWFPKALIWMVSTVFIGGMCLHISELHVIFYWQTKQTCSASDYRRSRVRDWVSVCRKLPSSVHSPG